MSSIRKFSSVKMFSICGLQLFCSAIALMCFPPTVFGQDVVTIVTGLASGTTLFNITMDTGDILGTGAVSDSFIPVAVTKIVPTVDCPTVRDDCLLLSDDIRKFFPDKGKDLKETRNFLNQLSVRSADYLPVTATLALTVTYYSRLERGLPVEITATTRLSLVLVEDPPPVLKDENAVSTIFVSNSPFMTAVFGTITVRDVQSTEFVVEVVSSIRITHICGGGSVDGRTDCLLFESEPTIAEFLGGSSQQRSVALAQGFLRSIPMKISGVPPIRATVTVSLESRLNDSSIPRKSTPLTYALDFDISALVPQLSDKSNLKKEGSTGGFMPFSSLRVTDVGGEEEVFTSVRLTQDCGELGENCLRLSPQPSSFGSSVFGDDPQDFLRSVIVVPIGGSSLSATVTVTVSSMLRGLARVSNELVYRLTFVSRAPFLSDSPSEKSGDVLGFSPFSSITVTAREADTITSVVVGASGCSRDRSTCLDIIGVDPIAGTAMQVQSSLRDLVVKWSADYRETREATVTVSLESSVRNAFGEFVSRKSTPLTYRLTFTVSDPLPQLSDDKSNLKKEGSTGGFMPFSSLRVTDVRGDEEVFTSVRLIQDCGELGENCLRLSPQPSSFGSPVFGDDPQDFLRSVIVGTTDGRSLSATVTVTVSSMLRGLARVSNKLVYRLTFVSRAPFLSDSPSEKSGDVLGFSPFSSITVTAREADTITSVVVGASGCSRDRSTCLDIIGVDPIAGTAMQVQSSLRDLVVKWSADYRETREATVTVSLESSVRNAFGEFVSRKSTPLTYRLTFTVSDPLPQLSDDKSNLKKEGSTGGFMPFSSLRVTDVRGDEEVFTSVRLIQDCGELGENCLRLSPQPSSFGSPVFGDDPQDFLRSVIVGTTDGRSLSATVTVTVSSMLRGLARVSNKLVYRLTFVSRAPFLSDSPSEKSGDVLGFSPFSSITVTAREADTITSVVVGSSGCSRDRSTCLDIIGVDPIAGTAMQVQSSLRDLVVKWSANYRNPREATVTVSLESSVRNAFGELVSRKSTPLTYCLSFTVSDPLPQLSDDKSNLKKEGSTGGFTPFSSLRVTDVRGDEEVFTSVRLIQDCGELGENCLRLSPEPSSFGSPAFGDDPDPQDFLRSVIVVPIGGRSLSATVTVTVSSMLRGLARVSNELVYRLTFVSRAPFLSDSPSEKSGDVLGFSPFSSITVTAREADTITSVVVGASGCSRDRSTCLDIIGVDPIAGTAMQVQSSLRDLVVKWSADYRETREATVTVSLESSVRNAFGELLSRKSTPLTYRLTFTVSDPLPQLSDDKSNLKKEGSTGGFMPFSSLRVTDVGGEEEVFTSVRLIQDCGDLGENCLRLSPEPSSFGSPAFGDDPDPQDFLRSMTVGTTDDRSLSATVTVTVSSMLRGLARVSNKLVYRLTFVSRAPFLSDSSSEKSGDVLGFSPFSSVTVTAREADTITSVVVGASGCSRDRSTCLDIIGVDPIAGTAMQVQSSLRDLVVKWSANYRNPREATVTVSLESSVRTAFGELVSRKSTPLTYRLTFTVSDLPPMLDDASGLDKTGFVGGFEPFAEITLSDDDSRGGTESITGIRIAVDCVGGATTCTAYVGDGPGDFAGGTLSEAQNFLRKLQVRSRFASYSARLSVTVRTVLRELPRQSNTLVYTLTFPTLGRLRDDRPKSRFVVPEFAVDLGVNPYDLDEVRNAVKEHCGGDYFEDSDGDGVPNNVEAQLGTDCRNDDPDNVAGGEERPLVTVDTSEAQMLDKLPFTGSLSELEIQCRGCVEIFFLEKQAVCTSASADSVLGNGSIAFPGVNQSSCYQAGYYSSSATAAPSPLTGTIFPVPTWSELYVLGIDKYGNWSVSNSGALDTKVVYTLAVLSLGPDLYALGDMANVTVEFRGRWTQASPDLSLPAVALAFTLDVNGTKFPGSFPNPVHRGTMTIPVDVSDIDAGSMLIVSLDDSNFFAVGRSVLTILKGEAPPFITIGLMEEGNPDPVSVVSLDDGGAGYSLNVGPAGTASTLAITTGEGMVLVSGQTDNLSDLLARLSDLPDGYAILKVRASLADNTREAEFPVFWSLKNAESGAEWTRGVVDRGIVIAGCSPFPCDDGNLAASVNLGQESYLSQVVVASSIRDFAASFDKVREILNAYVSGQLLDSDLSSTRLLTDVISYSGFASNVTQDRASFVLDLRHKPFWVPGRLVKRILVDNDYKWRGVDNFAADGSVSYTTRRDSTCPDPDAEAAWSDTDNGLIPASESTPIRCVRLTIVDGGLYDVDGDVDGYYTDPTFGVSDADFDPSQLAHAGVGGGGDDITWVIVLAALSGFLYGGSSGVWMLLALVLVLALSLRRRCVPRVQTRLK